MKVLYFFVFLSCVPFLCMFFRCLKVITQTVTLFNNNSPVLFPGRMMLWHCCCSYQTNTKAATVMWVLEMFTVVRWTTHSLSPCYSDVWPSAFAEVTPPCLPIETTTSPWPCCEIHFKWLEICVIHNAQAGSTYLPRINIWTTNRNSCWQKLCVMRNLPCPWSSLIGNCDKFI